MCIILFYHFTLEITLRVTLKSFITLYRGYLSVPLSIPYSLTYIAPDCLAFETAAPNNLFRQRIRSGRSAVLRDSPRASQ